MLADSIRSRFVGAVELRNAQDTQTIVEGHAGDAVVNSAGDNTCLMFAQQLLSDLLQIRVTVEG
jgi:hypothetical protein